ncbi:MAG: hypothetical protein GQ535_16965 [Rhodobacteraceae bacterium]|nr:hypothetical protein [Paracoccaceae bacterium]
MKYLATALTLIASPTLADITPAQLLESWHTAFNRVQIDLTIGSQALDGEVLVLHDVQLTKRNPQSPSPPLMDWVRLSPLSDGTVSIALSSVENAGATMAHPTDPDTKITTRSRYEGLEIIATGSPEKVTYNLTADRLSFDQQSSMGPFVSDMMVAVSNLSLRYSQWEGANGNFRAEGHFAAETVAIEWQKSQDPISDPNDRLVIQRGEINLTEPSMPFEMTAPPAYFTNLDGPLQGFPEGLKMNMQLLGKQAVLHINGGNADPGFTVDVGTSDSNIALDIGETTLRYLFDFSQIAVASNNPALSDQPLTLGIEKLLLDLSMPFRKTGSAAPFALATHLENVEISPTVWDMVDPASVMARTPASLDLQITGEATLLVDLFDPEQTNTLTGPPFHVHALSLGRLDMRLENAALSGQGGVVLDNTIIDEATGMPEATGSINFAITGALALLDRVGRLPNMDPMMALGAKGALGMFAAPTSEADSFTSRIEFTNGGHISINGQQVK